MKNIEMKKINIDDFELFGEGGTSFTYNSKKDDTIMLKLYKDGFPIEEAENEFITNKRIEKFGFNIPRIFDMVNVNGKTGILFERIKNKISFSRMMTDDRTKIEYCAKEMATYGRKLHTTPCDTNLFVNRKEYFKETILKTSLSNDVKEILMNGLSNVKDEASCLHGDFQPSNFLYANDNIYMIDLGNFSYGNHMFDIGGLYFSCNVIITEKEKIDIFHMSLEDLKLFFDIFARHYVENDEELLKQFYKDAKRFAAFFTASTFRFMGEPKEKQEIYENRIKELSK